MMYSTAWRGVGKYARSSFDAFRFHSCSSPRY